MRARLPELSEETLERVLRREVRRGERPDADEFAGRDAEMRHYAWRGRGRFAATLGVLDSNGLLAAGTRMLDVGADPWLLTQLVIERGVVPGSAAKRRGVFNEDTSEPSPQPIELRWPGHEARVEHHLFDAERDRWPFSDASFDCVLCAEVLEHLVFNPSHVLFEASRVLKPGGALVLTTPNAVSARKLALQLRGRNVHWAYSGYGPHGRHNREYTAAELRELLAAANFSARVDTRNIAGYEADEPLGRFLQRVAGARLARRADRGENLVAVARPAGPPRMPTPDWLYRSFDRAQLRAEGVLLIDEAAETSTDSNSPSGSPATTDAAAGAPAAAAASQHERSPSNRSSAAAQAVGSSGGDTS